MSIWSKLKLRKLWRHRITKGRRANYSGQPPCIKASVSFTTGTPSSSFICLLYYRYTSREYREGEVLLRWWQMMIMIVISWFEMTLNIGGLQWGFVEIMDWNKWVWCWMMVRRSVEEWRWWWLSVVGDHYWISKEKHGSWSLLLMVFGGYRPLLVVLDGFDIDIRCSHQWRMVIDLTFWWTRVNGEEV